MRHALGWLVLIAGVHSGCARPATHYDRVLHLASRDLGCPAFASTGDSRRADVVRAIAVTPSFGPYWRASCRGRTARYRCDLRMCRRDEENDATLGDERLDAGALECRTIGHASDGGSAAAAALRRAADRIAACGAEVFLVRVAPLTGTLAIEFVARGAPPGAGACIHDAIGPATAAPAPADEQLVTCRPRP